MPMSEIWPSMRAAIIDCASVAGRRCDDMIDAAPPVRSHVSRVIDELIGAEASSFASFAALDEVAMASRRPFWRIAARKWRRRPCTRTARRPRGGHRHQLAAKPSPSGSAALPRREVSADHGVIVIIQATGAQAQGDFAGSQRPAQRWTRLFARRPDDGNSAAHGQDRRPTSSNFPARSGGRTV